MYSSTAKTTAIAASVLEELSMSRWSNFRNPPLGWRIVIVAGLLAAPGVIAGAMVGLLVGAFGTCTVIGGLLGASVGALMEAWPFTGTRSQHDATTEGDDDATDVWGS
jgi:hypothetical protein